MQTFRTPPLYLCKQINKQADYEQETKPKTESTIE